MPHLALVLMIVGAFVLILGMVIYVRAHLENPSEEMAPFRHYFGTEDERDLLRQTSRHDGENLRDSIDQAAPAQLSLRDVPAPGGSDRCQPRVESAAVDGILGKPHKTALTP